MCVTANYVRSFKMEVAKNVEHTNYNDWFSYKNLFRRFHHLPCAVTQKPLVLELAIGLLCMNHQFARHKYNTQPSFPQQAKCVHCFFKL